VVRVDSGGRKRVGMVEKSNAEEDGAPFAFLGAPQGPCPSLLWRGRLDASATAPVVTSANPRAGALLSCPFHDVLRGALGLGKGDGVSRTFRPMLIALAPCAWDIPMDMCREEPQIGRIPPPPPPAAAEEAITSSSFVCRGPTVGGE
jgi:hypothetical protein